MIPVSQKLDKKKRPASGYPYRAFNMDYYLSVIKYENPAKNIFFY